MTPIEKAAQSYPTQLFPDGMPTLPGQVEDGLYDAFLAGAAHPSAQAVVEAWEACARLVDGWHRHSGFLNATQLSEDEWFRGRIAAAIRAHAELARREGAGGEGKG
jgi:hypothetical protein